MTTTLKQLICLITIFYLSSTILSAQNITLTTQAEVDAFDPSIDSINGSLRIIENPFLNDLIVDLSTLSGLEYVQDLRIESNDQLVSLVGLENINSIDFLIIENNDLLQNLSGLSGLENIGFMAVRYNDGFVSFSGLANTLNIGELSISSNDILVSLVDLGNINSIGNLNVVNNNMLQDFGNSPANTEYTGSVYLNSNDQLISLAGLGNIDSLYRLLIWNNGMLEDLDGLSDLVYVIELSINDNNQLIDLTGLSNLEKVEWRLEIDNNLSLTSLAGLENIDSIGFGEVDEYPFWTGCKILNNNMLQDLNAFSGMDYMSNLEIENNDQLTNLSGLNSLTYLDTIWIQNNVSLSDLTGFSSNLTEIAYIDISDNTSLISIDDLSGINEISGDLILSNNPLLSSCCVIQPLLLDPNGIGGTATIANNLSGCSSIQDIFSSDCGFEVNVIEGIVHVDTDGDCVPDGNSIPYSDVLIQAVNSSGGTYYTSPDANGFYSIYVQDGDYEVSSIVNMPYIIPCAPFYPASLLTPGVSDTATVDITLSALYYCPYMEVDVTGMQLRECESNTYTITYCNNGIAPANGAYMELTLDSLLTIVSAGEAFSGPDANNVYTFQLGDIAATNCESFTIDVQIPCPTGFTGEYIGQTFCVDAHVYPDYNCLPVSGTWDGSITEVFADCDQDSVRFRIRNVGASNMINPRTYFVIEDQVMFNQGSYQLDAGEERELAFFANGSTFRLDAEQAVDFPGISQPSVVVEACGNTSVFSLGFVNQFWLDELSSFTSIECIEVTGPYDPNDKQGMPIGYGEEHYIERNSSIDYLIRFQNIGNDTAYQIVIKDELSSLLDVSTFDPLASSHDYTFMIEDGLVTFTFDDILLVDSFTNEPESHGFIKYRISQLPDLPIGSEIENTAEIYFDSNAPIITNTTLHTIGENFIEINLIDNVAETYGIEQILVYPNPSNADIFIDMEDIQGDVFIRMFDAFGREVLSREMNTFPFRVETNGLSTGIYFFEIIVNNQKLGTGKVSLF